MALWTGRHHVQTHQWTWKGALPRGGILYFEAEDGTGQSELTPATAAKVVRLNHYYPARETTKSYSDFDRKTWIARLGMMETLNADEKVGVLAEGLPDILDVAVKVEGKLRKLDADSLLGIRVDYRVNGAYAKAVLFHGPYNGVDLYEKRGKTAMPWGLRQSPADVVAVKDLAKFPIGLRGRAPAGWSGGSDHVPHARRGCGRAGEDHGT